VAVLHVRTVHLESAGWESESYELAPSSEQAERVCALFRDFLANRPPGFRDKVGFVNRGDVEMEWAAAPGGVALASFFTGGEPRSMSVLLAGISADADRMMLDSFGQVVPLPRSDLDAAGRPLLVNAIFPGEPEFTPAIQLLTAALASVYFRTVLKLAGAPGGGLR
jgi:hypothetical protein